MDEHPPNFLQVSFLPWVELSGSLTVDLLNFWPFPAEADLRINDQNIRNHLTKYFRCYVDHEGYPVKTLAVCSHSNTDFRVLSEPENQHLRRAVDALLFANIAPQTKVAVCSKNPTMSPASSNVFELITQNFQPGSDEIAVRAGSVLSGGWKIGRIVFPKPWETGGMLGTPDSKLLQGLGKCLSPQFSGDVRERIFRGLEWFRMAHMEGNEVSAFSKIVMMATAFEIFLQFPREGKRRHFVNFMETRIASSEFNKDVRTSENRNSFNLSLAGCWGWDFYELRSRMIHGDQVADEELRYRNWLTHLIVADLVFLECVKRELFEQQCIGDDIRKCANEWDDAFPENQTDTSTEQLARWFLGFDDVHKALGWLQGNLRANTSLNYKCLALRHISCGRVPLGRRNG
jgi:hypothetical protein